MVVSVLNNKVSYPEVKYTDFDDNNFLAETYQVLLHSIDVIIAIGKQKNTYENYSIIFFPIYLITHNNTFIQIGVYEVNVNNLVNYLDEEGNLQIDLLDQYPLLYSFTTKEMLLKNRQIPDNPINECDEEEEVNNDSLNTQTQTQIQPREIPSIRKEIFSLKKGYDIIEELPQESFTESVEIMGKYMDSKDNNWVQKMMKNTNYSMNDTTNVCIFYVIKKAFDSIDEETTIEKIKTSLSKEITQSVFDDFKKQYDLFNANLKNDTRIIKELSSSYKDLQEKFNKTINTSEQSKLRENAIQLKAEHDKLVMEKKSVSKMGIPLQFMKNIQSVDELKAYVRKCDSWNDEWMLPTLERMLNLKFVILSEDAFKTESYNDILLCGQIDPDIKEKELFQPEYYIIISQSGERKTLVGYKEKYLLNYKEIPYNLKKMIVEKCVQNDSGMFKYIPNFQKFVTDTSSDDLMHEYGIATLQNLYDPNIIFQFYSKSVNKPPGKGSGETIPNERLIDFKELVSIPNWRKKLSNLWVDINEDTKQIQPIVIDNHKWASAEHYYQASKFKKNNPEFYLSFSLDSGTDLSKNPDMAKAAGGKTGKYNKELIRPKQVTIDADFFNGRHEEEMNKSQYAKFTQSFKDNLKKMLLATGKAKLMHYSKGQPPIVYENLMKIRDEFRKKNEN